MRCPLLAAGHSGLGFVRRTRQMPRYILISVSIWTLVIYFVMEHTYTTSENTSTDHSYGTTAVVLWWLPRCMHCDENTGWTDQFDIRKEMQQPRKIYNIKQIRSRAEPEFNRRQATADGIYIYPYGPSGAALEYGSGEVSVKPERGKSAFAFRVPRRSFEILLTRSNYLLELHFIPRRWSIIVNPVPASPSSPGRSLRGNKETSESACRGSQSCFSPGRGWGLDGVAWGFWACLDSLVSSNVWTR